MSTMSILRMFCGRQPAGDRLTTNTASYKECLKAKLGRLYKTLTRNGVTCDTAMRFYVLLHGEIREKSTNGFPQILRPQFATEFKSALATVGSELLSTKPLPDTIQVLSSVLREFGFQVTYEKNSHPQQGSELNLRQCFHEVINLAFDLQG